MAYPVRVKFVKPRNPLKPGFWESFARLTQRERRLVWIHIEKIRRAYETSIDAAGRFPAFFLPEGARELRRTKRVFECRFQHREKEYYIIYMFPLHRNPEGRPYELGVLHCGRMDVLMEAFYRRLLRQATELFGRLS